MVKEVVVVENVVEVVMEEVVMEEVAEVAEVEESGGAPWNSWQVKASCCITSNIASGQTRLLRKFMSVRYAESVGKAAISSKICAVRGGKPPTLVRPEASSRGHGAPPSRSRGAVGSVGAAWAIG